MGSNGRNCAISHTVRGAEVIVCGSPIPGTVYSAWYLVRVRVRVSVSVRVRVRDRVRVRVRVRVSAPLLPLLFLARSHVRLRG